MQAEQLSEQRRLLYVAMTRAIFKLYVPRIKNSQRTSGCLGPLGPVLLPALELAAPEIKLGEMIVNVVTPADALSARNRAKKSADASAAVPRGRAHPVGRSFRRWTPTSAHGASYALVFEHGPP